MDVTSGIYKLQFSNGSFYIGRSANIEKRFIQHLYSLRNNKSNYKLQKAFLIDSNPTYSILETCSLDIQKIREIFWISKLGADTSIYGLNLSKGGEDFSTGENHSQSKYSNEQVSQVLDLVCMGTSDIHISTITGVSIAMVYNITSLKNHTWLKEKYPEKYCIMEKLYNSKTNKISHENTSTIENIFIYLVNNPNISLREASITLNCTYDLVRSISKCSASYSWLKDKFPKEYAILKSVLGTRLTGNSSNRKFYFIQNPEGNIYKVNNIAEFSRQNNLNNTALGKVLNGKSKSHKGWKAYIGVIT